MGLGIGLSAGLKALAAARLGIETAGQNVANANTPGYTRQQVLQSSSMPAMYGGRLQIGTGVEINDIRRMADAGIERRLRVQLATFGGAQVDYFRWSEIESVFNEPDGGLSGNFTDFFGSIEKLQTQPANSALRGSLAQEGGALANALNALDRRFNDIEKSSFHEIDGHVRRINVLSNGIAKLNDQIAIVEVSGTSANDLRDQREQMIKEIGEMMDVVVLDRNSGSADVQVNGQLLVSGNNASQLEAKRDVNGKTVITIRGKNAPIIPDGGRIEGLLRHEQGEIPKILAKLDRMAKNLALEFNRIHTTGVPLAGYYEHSLSANPVRDLNSNGTLGDDLLTNSGLPFDIENGEIYVAITDKASGDVQRTRIPIHPASMSLHDVATALDSITHLDASVDTAGRLRVTSQPGYGFDFSTRLDPRPDDLGTFGGAQPSMASAGTGPFNLTVPATLRVTINGTNHDIGFAASQFTNPSTASVDEVVAAMNADAGFASSGLAANVGGRLVVRSNSAGSNSTLTITEPGPGTPLSQLKLPASPNTKNGQAAAVEVSIGGKYTGANNGQFTFVANGSGTIGATPGLEINVFDANGVKVATLDAGPRTRLLDDEPVAVAEGVTLSLSPGSLTDGQVFAVDTLADSDTSDFLVAIGMNNFFQGSSAGDLAVDPDLANNPHLLAASANGQASDATNLDRLLALRESGLTELDANSFEDFYGELIGQVGFDTAGAETIMFAEDQLMTALQAQRESISGVNLDEEMIELVKYQQAFEAASRFINTVNEITQMVINLGR